MDGHSELGLIGENFDPGLVGRMKEDGYESGSDNGEGASGDDQDSAAAAADGQPKKKKKKKYHRHTPFQIQELESYACFILHFFGGFFFLKKKNWNFWSCLLKLIIFLVSVVFSSSVLTLMTNKDRNLA